MNKKEDIKDGDIITIASEGLKFEGQYGPQDVFLVKLKSGDEKNMALNQTSINNMVDAFGADSVKWVGQKVKVWIIKAMVSGKMQNVVYLSHPEAEMNDEGGFSLNNSKKSPDASADEIEF